MPSLKIASTSESKIEKGVPIPDRKSGRLPKYPWADMEVGDSIAVPLGVPINSFRHCASMAGRRLGRKFTVRKLPDGSFRCWRVE